MPQIPALRLCFLECCMAQGWYRSRNYPHFDRPVSAKFALSYVESSANIARHSFFPFISYVATTPRYRKDDEIVVAKERVISYASHLDSHVFAYYGHLLVKRLEAIYDREACGDSVSAYRSLGKSNIDFANEAFDDITDLGSCVAKAFDITGFFDNIHHKLLKTSWARLLDESTIPDDHYSVFRAVTRFANVDRPALYSEFDIDAKQLKRGPFRICTIEEFRSRVRGNNLVGTNSTGVGIPQGSPISAVLSNLYMLEFDRKMTELAASYGAKYRRYSDDILFICPAGSDQRIEKQFYDEVRSNKLESNPDKTDTVRYSQLTDGTLRSDAELQYLGFTFDGERRRIRSQTLAKYYRRARRAIRHAKNAAKQNGSDIVFKCDIYERYTHLGKRNFLGYAYRASRKMRDKSIRRQLSRHWDRVQEMLGSD